MKTDNISNESLDVNDIVYAWTIDILSEDFIIPDCNCDLQELIESSIDQFNVMPLCRKETRDYRRKVNELIDTYNERREMRIYSHI